MFELQYHKIPKYFIIIFCYYSLTIQNQKGICLNFHLYKQSEKSELDSAKICSNWVYLLFSKYALDKLF